MAKVLFTRGDVRIKIFATQMFLTGSIVFEVLFLMQIHLFLLRNLVLTVDVL